MGDLCGWCGRKIEPERAEWAARAGHVQRKIALPHPTKRLQVAHVTAATA